MKRLFIVVVLCVSLMSSGCVGTIILATVLLKKHNAAEKAKREGTEVSCSEPVCDCMSSLPPKRRIAEKDEGSE